MSQVAEFSAPEKTSCVRQLKQQKLKSCRPSFTPVCVIAFFVVSGLACVAAGAVFAVASNGVSELVIDTTSCDPNDGVSGLKNCSFPFSVKTSWKGPVYVYYQITNLLQNHRRYVKSQSGTQLAGKSATWTEVKSECAPRSSINGDGDKDSPQNWYLPCGLLPWTQYNDTILLQRSDGTLVYWTYNGIAWETDKRKYKNPPSDMPGVRDPIVDFTDPDFMNWMKTAGLPDFRKLYRILPDGLPAGDYSFEITSRYHVKNFGGTKGMVVSTVSYLGGKNPFFGIAYIVVGGLLALLGLVFFCANRVKHRDFGDPAYIWADQGAPVASVTVAPK